MNKPSRILIAKIGLDGHDRGAIVIAKALRDAGFEVIYTGIRNTPESIVTTAIQEDVRAIGISIHSGAHNRLVSEVMNLLRKNECGDIAVVVGGIIPADDAGQLKKSGVGEIFGPGSRLTAIVDWMKNRLGEK